MICSSPECQTTAGCICQRSTAVPTQWAYDAACKALHAQRERAEKAEARIKALETALAEEREACAQAAEWSAEYFGKLGDINGAVACRDVAFGIRRRARSVLSEKQP